ncbi:MAG: hypothetical protein ACE5KE_00345 [Methanosarcinales archaeon]
MRILELIPPVIATGMIIKAFPLVEEVSRLAEERYKKKVVSIQELI